MLKNGTSASPATARASSVLPVPAARPAALPCGICSPSFSVLAGITQEVHDLDDLVLGLIDTRDVGERGPLGRGGVVPAGFGLAHAQVAQDASRARRRRCAYTTRAGRRAAGRGRTTAAAPPTAGCPGSARCRSQSRRCPAVSEQVVIGVGRLCVVNCFTWRASVVPFLVVYLFPLRPLDRVSCRGVCLVVVLVHLSQLVRFLLRPSLSLFQHRSQYPVQYQQSPSVSIQLLYQFGRPPRPGRPAACPPPATAGRRLLVAALSPRSPPGCESWCTVALPFRLAACLRRRRVCWAAWVASSCGATPVVPLCSVMIGSSYQLADLYRRSFL